MWHQRSWGGDHLYWCASIVTLQAATVSLAKEAIAASAGAACASKESEPSHVLSAMGVPQTAIHGTIRFSSADITSRKRSITFLRKFPPSSSSFVISPRIGYRGKGPPVRSHIHSSLRSVR